jgi:predicted nucleotidyltransferase
MPAHIQFDREKLAEFCRKWKIKRLSLFGSVLRDDFRPDSDVDVLYEFEPDAAIGYFKLVELEDELSQLLGGRTVDFVPAKYLKERLRDEILRTAEVQYAA